MKIGIVVYSQTGNTKSVAEGLKERLADAGHEAKIEEVVPEGDVHPGKKDVSYSSKPELSGYDSLVIAAPVQAFSLSVGMKAYLQQLEPGSFKDKKMACFVTKQLPGKWTGGKRALRQIQDLCSEKGGSIAASEIIIWSSKKREEMIDRTLETMSTVL